MALRTVEHGSVRALGELVPIVVRKDRTIGQFGFTKGESTEFAVELAGRVWTGLSYSVRHGPYSATWDGHDLLVEFSRLVAVQAWPEAIVPGVARGDTTSDDHCRA